MMNKRVAVMSVLVGCLMFVGYMYLKQPEDEVIQKETTYQKVVFQDKNHDLIPVSVPIYSQVELEEDVRNRIELMKSHELEKYGLYPVFNENLEVESVESQNNHLIVSFNDELYSQDSMDILETLSYTLTDYDGVEKLQIQIEGKDVAYLPNSFLPLNALTKDLGLNNFTESSHLLHETIPIMAYQLKDVEQFSYYVPVTLRLDENISLKQQVQTILSYVEEKIHVQDVSLNNHVLTIELDENILLDNEKIDAVLEDLIVLSLTSLNDVDDVKIQINKEDVRTKKSSQINYNCIKI